MFNINLLANPNFTSGIDNWNLGFLVKLDGGNSAGLELMNTIDGGSSSSIYTINMDGGNSNGN